VRGLGGGGDAHAVDDIGVARVPHPEAMGRSAEGSTPDPLRDAGSTQEGLVS
jgi:hypothetical protein